MSLHTWVFGYEMLPSSLRRGPPMTQRSGVGCVSEIPCRGGEIEFLSSGRSVSIRSGRRLPLKLAALRLSHLQERGPLLGVERVAMMSGSRLPVAESNSRV